jgi:hypothetical protein
MSGWKGQRQVALFDFGAAILDKPKTEATLYSLTESPPEPPHRRSAERYLSLMRVGALLVEGRRELCLIRNLSAGGMMIRAYSPIAVGTPLSVELKHGESVSGHVQWAEDNLTGIAFESPIDVLSLIAPANDGPAPRMPRILLDCTAWVREGADTRRAKTLNISQGGLCIESARDLTVGAAVTVSLPGLAPMGATVKWRDGECYGIGFNHILALSDLVEWLQARQQRERRRAAG